MTLRAMYAEDKEVMYYLDNACYPNDSRNVWSPRPEELYVPTQTPEPEATEDSVIHTLSLPLMGKEYQIGVIGKRRTDMDYWCWNPEVQQFEYAFTLQLTDVDVVQKQLISYQKVGGGVYYPGFC